MNRSWRCLTLAAAAILSFGVKEAEACACVAREMSPEQNRQDLVEQLGKAFAVFSGEVVRLDAFSVQFRLEDVWKGEFGEHIVMPINAGQNPDGTVAYSSCDYGFQVGRKYLVFAYGKSASTMRAHSCTRTTELQPATAETIELLDKIGKRRPKKPEGPLRSAE
jgi:hypothetical protein